MYSDQLPFARGKVFGVTANTDGPSWLGNEWIVEDKDPADPVKKRSNRFVTLRAVRNSSTVALLPKRVVRYKTTTLHTEVDGYTALTSQYFAGVVDEFLPAAGVPVGDVFFIAVKGPTLCLTDIAPLASVIAEDDQMVASTAAASTAAATPGTDGGRVSEAAFTGSTAVLGEQIMNRVGRALSAKTTGNTNADILIDLRADY